MISRMIVTYMIALVVCQLSAVVTGLFYLVLLDVPTGLMYWLAAWILNLMHVDLPDLPDGMAKNDN